VRCRLQILGSVAAGRRTGVPAPIAAPELERLRIFDGALRLVEWAAVGRPVLLVAEDVHRADRASLQLTTHIGRRLAGLPVMLVAAVACWPPSAA
jgi:predicted ATPase